MLRQFLDMRQLFNDGHNPPLVPLSKARQNLAAVALEEVHGRIGAARDEVKKLHRRPTCQLLAENGVGGSCGRDPDGEGGERARRPVAVCQAWQPTVPDQYLDE